MFRTPNIRTNIGTIFLLLFIYATKIIFGFFPKIVFSFFGSNRVLTIPIFQCVNGNVGRLPLARWFSDKQIIENK